MADDNKSKKALTGSPEAKRKAAVILEAMCGLRTTQSASDELEITMPRYYVLESRMMQAMISALEPRERGRQRTLSAEVKQLNEEKAVLEREVLKLQALHRVTQRAVGVGDEVVAARKRKKKASTVKTNRTRRPSRGARIASSMRAENAPPTTMPGDSKPGGT